MLNFSRWTPTLGVYFKWDSQKVLKIAHIGIFRHIGGVRWVRKITDIKILWVKVLHAKNGDFSTTRGWEINFFRQNIAMFDWLCTETYLYQLRYFHEWEPGKVSIAHFQESSGFDHNRHTSGVQSILDFLVIKVSAGKQTRAASRSALEERELNMA